MQPFRSCLEGLHAYAQGREQGQEKPDKNGDGSTTFHDLVNATTSSSDDLLLSTDDGLKLLYILQSVKSNLQKELCLTACAELAKLESNREVLANTGVILGVLDLLEASEDTLLLQSLRVIGNSCIDCDLARNQVLNSGCLPVLVKRVDSLTTTSIPSKLPATMFGCITNIAADNEDVQRQLIELKAVEASITFLRKNKTIDVTTAVMAINAISGLVAQVAGLKQLYECQGLEVLFSMIGPNADYQIVQSILDIVGDFADEDDFRDAVCEAGLVPTLVSFIEHHPCFQLLDTDDEVFKVATDTVVLMTSGEKSFNRLKDDQALLRRFREWLSCSNKHVQTSAGLVICNYARNETLCHEMVKEGIHEMLVAFVGTCLLCPEDYSGQLQAACSAIKNLAIPVANKPILADTPLPVYAVELVMKAPSPVQYKALAIIRLLVQDQSSLAVRLVDNLEFLRTIVELSKIEIPVGLAAESQRTVAALAKYSKSSASCQNIVSTNGIRALTRLLKAEHVLMQNEAIFALITIMEAVKESIPVVLNSDCMEIVRSLMASTNTEQGVLFNILAFLTILHESDQGALHFKALDLEPLVTNLTQHSQHLVRSRASELVRRLKE